MPTLFFHSHLTITSTLHSTVMLVTRCPLLPHTHTHHHHHHPPPPPFPSLAAFKLGSPKPRPGAASHGAAHSPDDDSTPQNGGHHALPTPHHHTNRMLGLQKQLLHQIAERKKLIASVKANVGNSVKEIKSYNEDGMSKIDNLGQALDAVVIHENQSSLEGKTGSETVKKSIKVVQSLEDPSAVAGSSLTSSGRLHGLESGLISASEKIKFQSNAPQLDVSVTSSNPESYFPASYSPPELHIEEDISIVTDRKSVLTEEVNKDDSRAGATTNKIADKTPLAGPNVMNVICVAAECAPWSKTGGLGDVVGSLPKALAHRGHRVMVVVPRYENYQDAQKAGMRKIYNVAGQDMEVQFYHIYTHGVDYVFIDNPIFYGFSKNIYGGSHEDILKRMILFCKAAVEVQWHVPCGGVCYGDGNLVFIANDWHTALIPVYLQAYYRDHGIMKYARAILIIHNIAHQGRGPLSGFAYLALPDHYIEKFRLYDPVGGEHMNIFMAGLITAHRIVAVSHGYAWECQTQDGGWGLDGVIREQGWKLQGIVNGIDDKDWNPELDAFLQSDGYSNYGVQTLETGKAKCKAALQKEFCLPVRSDVPLLGFIGRLDHQKGVDIIAESMHWLMEQDLQLILLGSGRADLENMLRSFECQYRDKVRGWVGFSIQTAHRITAGADLLLMPSRFEPCGLNQLYAMRYGTIPVVHAVGGLRDTVQNFNPYANTGTGWTFDRADTSAMIHALGNSLWTYREFKDSWLAIQRQGMAQDLSWDKAAKKYEEVLISAKYQW